MGWIRVHNWIRNSKNLVAGSGIYHSEPATLVKKPEEHAHTLLLTWGPKGLGPCNTITQLVMPSSCITLIAGTQAS